MFRALVVFLLLPSMSFACESYVIGFRGKNGAFDNHSFKEYTGSKCSKLYNADQIDTALDFIKNINTPYELYGFSLGAVSVSRVLAKASVRPSFVLTIGAHSTADVNFDKYKIKYKNYFDNTGIRQKSPGVHVKNVNHMNMQKYVNKELQ
jgi:hypothetical protein